MKTNLRDVFDIPNKEYEHHLMRVENLISKGDVEKQKKLAITMANKIRDIDKAYGRYLVCEELNASYLGKIFLTRFKELTYTIHDWRKEKIDNFLKEIELEENGN